MLAVKVSAYKSLVSRHNKVWSEMIQEENAKEEGNKLAPRVGLEATTQRLTAAIKRSANYYA